MSKEWEPQYKEKRLSIPVRNILKIAWGTLGSTAHQYFYDLVDGKVINILEDGSKACAAVLSHIIICVRYKNHIFLQNPHATVAGLVSDLEQCGWVEIDTKERRPGSIVVWQKINGNKHIGIGISECAVMSNCKTKKVPVLHRWTTESDDKTPREIERIFWHPLFDDKK